MCHHYGVLLDVMRIVTCFCCYCGLVDQCCYDYLIIRDGDDGVGVQRKQLIGGFGVQLLLLLQRLLN